MAKFKVDSGDKVYGPFEALSCEDAKKKCLAQYPLLKGKRLHAFCSPLAGNPFGKNNARKR